MFRSNPESIGSAARSNLSIPVFLMISLAVCVIGVVVAPALVGAVAGYQQLQIENHENAILHYQRGLGYLSENYPDLALAEFQISLRYDGRFDPASQKLGEMQAKVAAEKQNAAGTPSSIGIAGKLLDEARLYVSQKQWNDAINRLEQLKGLDASSQTPGINDLLFQSYSESGKQAVANGQIEFARERFDAALTLRKDPEMLRQRDMAVLYLDGQQAAGNDLPNAIQKFLALYQQDSNYNDVKKRLVDAYVQYGDRAAKENAWCLAAREYDRANSLTSDSQSNQKYNQAITRCKQGALVTPTVTVAITPGTTPGAIPDTYALLRNTPTAQPCTGNGDISGSVRDSLGNPLVGFYVAYEGENINRISTATDANGQFKLGLGRDAAALSVFVLNGDGKTPAGFIVNVKYPGGANPGCHIVVEWQKAQ